MPSALCVKQGFDFAPRFMTERASDARVFPFARMFVLQFERAERFSRMTFYAISAAHRHLVIGIGGHGFDLGFRRKVSKTTDDGEHEQGEKEITFEFHIRVC